MNIIWIKAVAAIIWLLYSSKTYVTGNYDIHVLFYEFRNPSNLACANHYCTGDGGAPNCCDSLAAALGGTNCLSQCRPQFRLSLKEFGTRVNDVSRHGSNIFYTGRFNTSSVVFSQGDFGLISASNPFVVTETSEWRGRIQLFIDAIDPDVGKLGQGNTIIAYGIDLELILGEGFTQKAMYVSQVWTQLRLRSITIDLSFKVRCSKYYYGLSCGTFCKPVEGVSTCDQNGNVTILSEIICMLTALLLWFSSCEPASREKASNQTTMAADNNCTLMPCTSETESESQEPIGYIKILAAVFASLFVLSLTFIVIMVIIAICQKLRIRNVKSSELSQKKPSTLAHTTITDKMHNDIEVEPNQSYGNRSACFKMDSNELYHLGQLNTPTEYTMSYEAI